jgi:hypothetical protein
MPDLTANSDATTTNQISTIGGRTISGKFTHTQEVTDIITYDPKSDTLNHHQFGRPVDLFYKAKSTVPPTSEASTLRQNDSESTAHPSPSDAKPGTTLSPTTATAPSDSARTGPRKRFPANYFKCGTWGTDSPNRVWPNEDKVYLREPLTPTCPAGFGMTVDETTGKKFPVAYVSRNIGYDEDGFPQYMEQSLESLRTELGTRGTIKYAVVPSQSGNYERWFAGARQKRADGVMYWEDEWEGPMVVSNYVKRGTAAEIFGAFTAQSSTPQ